MTNVRQLTGISEIRHWIDSNKLDAKERQVADGALEIIRKHWAKRRTKEYERGVAERDRQIEKMDQLAWALKKAQEKLKADRQAGTLTDAEAHSRYKDLEAERHRRIEQYKAIVAQDDALEALDAESVSAYQERNLTPTTVDLSKFPAAHGVEVKSKDMTFGQAIDKYLSGPRR